MKKISKYEIYSLLQSRLLSHDRSPKIGKEKFHFLPKLYDSIFDGYDRSYSNELISLQIQNIKLYYCDPIRKIHSTKYSDISDFHFDVETKLLYIELENEFFNLVTPIKKTHNAFDDYEPLKLIRNTFSSATIDHNPTFVEFVEGNIENLKTLVEISRFIKNKRRSKYSAKNRSIINEFITTKYLRDALWRELNYIAENQTLEIVDEKYNNK